MMRAVQSVHNLRCTRLGSRRLLVTVKVSRLPNVDTQAKPTLSITGFGPQFAPSAEQCLLIVNRALRPLGEDGKPTPIKRVDKVEDLFEEVLTYSSNGESEVIVRLKSREYLPYLPIARPIDEPEAAFNEFTRFSWAGLLLPVLDGKIVLLSAKYRATLKSKRLFEKIQWFPIHFRHFQPDVLRVEAADEQSLRETITGMFPEVTMDIMKGARLNFVDDVKSRKKRTIDARADSSIILKCESSQDVFHLRQVLSEKGFQCRPQRTTTYDFFKAFRESQYNNSETASAWARRLKTADDGSKEENDAVEPEVVSVPAPADTSVFSQVVYSSYARAEDDEAFEFSGDESPSLELLSEKPAMGAESFLDLEYDEERSSPQAFIFRRDRARRYLEATSYRSLVGSSQEEPVRARSSS